MLIFDANPARPVYHRRLTYGEAGHRIEPDDVGRVHLAACGLLGDPGALHVRLFVIEHRHARKFARPCLRCWPSLKTGQLELRAGPLR